MALEEVAVEVDTSLAAVLKREEGYGGIWVEGCNQGMESCLGTNGTCNRKCDQSQLFIPPQEPERHKGQEMYCKN